MKGPNGVDVPTNVVRQVCVVPEMYMAVSVQDGLLSEQSELFYITVIRDQCNHSGQKDLAHCQIRTSAWVESACVRVLMWKVIRSCGVFYAQAVATDAGGRASDEGDDLTDGSGWETASDDDEADASAAAPNGTRSAGPAGEGAAAAAQSGQPRVGTSGVAPAGEAEAAGEWDVCRSLFDGHVAPSMAANLEYMWKRFGFYFPEAEHLADPEGLLKYLVRIVALCAFSVGCVGSLMQTSVKIGVVGKQVP